MARGKQTCKMLKEIRRQIAEANGIEYVTSECRYKGDCPGTCPKCEAEVRYLEQQLRGRTLAGKAVTLAGISAGMFLMSSYIPSTSNQSCETLQCEPMISAEQTEKSDTIKESEIQITNEVKTFLYVGQIYEELHPDENHIYMDVNKMPTFPGGNDELLRFVAQNIKYPPEAIKKGIEGRVIVKFYVDTVGRVCNPEIDLHQDPDLDAEALRVVSILPNFIPGELNGKKVNVYMALPLNFRLTHNTDSELNSN